jgi:hypothetical protein
LPLREIWIPRMYASKTLVCLIPGGRKGPSKS